MPKASKKGLSDTVGKLIGQANLGDAVKGVIGNVDLGDVIGNFVGSNNSDAPSGGIGNVLGSLFEGKQDSASIHGASSLLSAGGLADILGDLTGANNQAASGTHNDLPSAKADGKFDIGDAISSLVGNEAISDAIGGVLGDLLGGKGC